MDARMNFEERPFLVIWEDGTCGYSWRVPKNLKLDGSAETLTVQVRYDTLELYGKVSASRSVTVYRE